MNGLAKCDLSCSTNPIQRDEKPLWGRRHTAFGVADTFGKKVCMGVRASTREDGNGSPVEEAQDRTVKV